ncbi:MAG: di-trans,poly-cis-decaprenylcistransferase [Chloroflexi bacterium RBG_16_60_22]|nr:MAG: di-trans,poly-cis-decaprenylcistransferase [Chloroflexi bacterium RBG_16_60_22]
MEKDTGLPRHVAFIMDGNGRWAEQRGLPRLEGHRAGVQNIRPIITFLSRHGIEYLTIYAFSTENWSRPEDEVSGLFHLLEEVIHREARELHKNGIRIRHIGRLDGLTPALKKSIIDSVNLTRDNTGMTVGLAFNYGGRAEILDAVRNIMARGIPPAQLNERLFARYLYNPDFPDVDLVIRTGGEIRTSNFLIWQAAYAEYYFTPVLWPDFNEEELEKALQTYGRRQRRFGGLSSGAAC